MTAFSTNDSDALIDDLNDLIHIDLIDIQRIGGGKNSQVYRICCDKSKYYVVKRYFQNSSDQRDRLKIEFNSMNLLWKNGIRCIPEPVASDHDKGLAVYEYIEGDKLTSEKVTSQHIDGAVAFLEQLVELQLLDESKALPAASEASFSIYEITENITHRLNRLQNTPSEGVYFERLHRFLSDEFVPFFHKITGWCSTTCETFDISYNNVLPHNQRTLSPSDFGFHNALVHSLYGRIYFLDFEYFGWDDPAKIICDFLLHPAMQLNDDCYKQFAVKTFELYLPVNQYIRERSRLVYPLFGLKWVMILLNEFLSYGLQRYNFVQMDPQKSEIVLANQLLKAESMLDRIQREYRLPPFLSD